MRFLINHTDTRSENVKRNIIASLLLKGISIAVSFILIPLTLGYVSSETYGIWLTLSSMALWLGFLDAGFSHGLKNKLAEAIALNKWWKARKYVSTAYAVMIAIFIPVCLACLCFVQFINWSNLLNVDTCYNDDIKTSISIIAFFFCLQMIFGTITAVLAAMQRVAFSQSFYVIANCIIFVVIIILKANVSPSLEILSFALSSIPVLVIAIASIILYQTQLKRLSPSVKFIDFKYVKHIFNLGYKFFILQMQFLVMNQMTNFLISHVANPESVTSFNIAYKYIGIISMFFIIVTDPLWPAFTNAYTKKDFAWMNNVYLKMSKLRNLLEFSILLLVAISPLVYHLWIGDKASIPFEITIAVAVYYMTQLWTLLNITLINGIGAIKLQTYFAIAVSIIHIPLSLFLGSNLHAIGVLASLILLNLTYAIFSSVQINRLLSQKASGIWTK